MIPRRITEGTVQWKKSRIHSKHSENRNINITLKLKITVISDNFQHSFRKTPFNGYYFRKCNSPIKIKYIHHVLYNKDHDKHALGQAITQEILLAKSPSIVCTQVWWFLYMCKCLKVTAFGLMSTIYKPQIDVNSSVWDR